MLTVDEANARLRGDAPRLTVNAALDELVVLRGDMAKQGSPEAQRYAEALRQGIEALRGVAGAMREIEQVKAGEHTHICGVKGCGNRYACHGSRCAGAVWTCPACELDQKDDYNNHTL